MRSAPGFVPSGNFACASEMRQERGYFRFRHLVWITFAME